MTPSSGIDPRGQRFAAAHGLCLVRELHLLGRRLGARPPDRPTPA